ncbi:MAG: hypothetical protein GEV03_05490 [Streptosporangiales bacterium]|nr:hypothetical protein [Streptosporangiales bacterium]
MSAPEEEFAFWMNDLQRGDFYADATDRWNWFARLRLESVTIDENRVVSFVWRDIDGQRYGWRWKAPAPPASLKLGDTDMDYLLVEDIQETNPTEPDENGVRWLGVVRRDPRDWDDDRT